MFKTWTSIRCISWCRWHRKSPRSQNSGNRFCMRGSVRVFYHCQYYIPLCIFYLEYSSVLEVTHTILYRACSLDRCGVQCRIEWWKEASFARMLHLPESLSIIYHVLHKPPFPYDYLQSSYQCAIWHGLLWLCFIMLVVQLCIPVLERAVRIILQVVRETLKFTSSFITILYYYILQV